MYLSLLARNAIEEGISATMVRKYIVDDNPKLQEVVPSIIYNNREGIKQLISIQI